MRLQEHIHIALLLGFVSGVFVTTAFSLTLIASRAWPELDQLVCRI